MDYNEFYSEKGGFKAGSLEWLQEHTDLFEVEPGTLLDAGCGDGEWSILLAGRHEVTGLDLSEKGIESARERVLGDGESMPGGSAQFFCRDALVPEGEETWDYVFCRAPSFLNLPTSDPLFAERIRSLMDRCNKALYYIKYSAAPYERWVESNYFRGFDTVPDTSPDSRWYYNDPEKVRACLEEIDCGEVEVNEAGNYFIAKVSVR